MAKPVTLPRWVATGKIATPSTDKQDAGYDGGEQPPAQYFNWFWNLVWQWIVYLNTFGDHEQEFSAGVNMEGELYYSGGAELVRYNNRMQLVPIAPNLVLDKPGTMTIAWDASFEGLKFDDPTNDYEPDIHIPINIDWWVDNLKPVSVNYDLKGGTGTGATYVTGKIKWRNNAGVDTFTEDTASPVTTGSWVRHEIALDTASAAAIPNGAAVYLVLSFTGGSADLRADLRNVAIQWSTEE
jgi:hypothetical protein